MREGERGRGWVRVGWGEIDFSHSMGERMGWERERERIERGGDGMQGERVGNVRERVIE